MTLKKSFFAILLGFIIVSIYIYKSSLSTVVVYDSYSSFLLNRNATNFVKPNHSTALLQPFQNICSVEASRPFLLLGFTSAPGNIVQRNVIRDNWKNELISSDQVKIFFIVGKTKDPSLTLSIFSESKSNGDILQEDFIDSYSNLTIKSLMLLKYFNDHCSAVPYLVKIDDDTFLNIQNLYNLLKKNTIKNLLLGHINCYVHPIRELNNKWHASKESYNKLLYPPYLSGPAYIMSNSTAMLLYEKSLSIDMFHLEDVYITGILAEAAGIFPLHHQGFALSKIPLENCIYYKGLGAHQLTMEDMKKLPHLVKKENNKCSKIKYAIQNLKYSCKRLTHFNYRNRFKKTKHSS